MFTRLLVGLDGSPPSLVALSQAIQLGQRFEATIVLAHITTPELERVSGRSSQSAPWVEATRATPWDAAGYGAELLQDAAGAVARAGLRAEPVLTHGDAAAELRRLAADCDATLIGRAGLGANMEPLGPDARELIRQSPAPIIVCGARTSAFARCAVAYDAGPESVRALELAARFAGITGSALEIIHAAHDESAGRAVLARAAAALSQSPVRFEAHFAAGEVDTAIAAVVERRGCDALFTGAHHTEGRGHEVPSHTEALLRATDLAVVVVS